MIEDLNVNQKGLNGDCLLFAAARLADVQATEQLLEKGADVLASDNESNTALHFAIPVHEEGSISIVQLLLEAGADLHVANNVGDTPLHVAAYYGQQEIAQLLLSHGAASDCNRQNWFGETPLHKALCYGFSDMVQLLLNHDANTAIEDNDGKSALQQAIAGGWSDLAAMIAAYTDTEIQSKQEIVEVGVLEKIRLQRSETVSMAQEYQDFSKRLHEKTKLGGMQNGK